MEVVCIFVLVFVKDYFIVFIFIIIVEGLVGLFIVGIYRNFVEWFEVFFFFFVLVEYLIIIVLFNVIYNIIILFDEL